jgi:hypothetical protein
MNENLKRMRSSGTTEPESQESSGRRRPVTDQSTSVMTHSFSVGVTGIRSFITETVREVSRKKDYSSRSTSIGSLLDARYAGSRAAKKAASSNTPTLNPTVAGSTEVVS